MRTFIVNVELNIGKIHNVQIDRSGIRRQLLCQINDLLLRTLARIWRCMEIGRIQLYATLADHIACHRTVDASGEQQHCLSIRADRHTARPRNDL